MPSKIIILGGTGFTGKLIARHLLEQSNASITLAARHLDRAQSLAQELNSKFPGNRVDARFADAGNVASLRSAFHEEDLVVVASPATANFENVIQTALDCNIDYLDVQLSAQKFTLLQSVSTQIEQAGRCFITEAGFHPGLPSALVRYAACYLDEIESAITAGYLNMGKSLPYSEAFDELIDIFKGYQAQVHKNGKWTKKGSFDIAKIDFGGDIGRKNCYSMFFEELRLLPEMYPSLQNIGFYLSETHWLSDWVMMPLVMVWLKLAPKAVRPAGKFVWWSMNTFHKPPYRVELQVQASGLKNGKPADFKAVVSHPDGYELTAIPVVAALLQYMDGSARKPGLWMMGHLPEPGRLMEDMQKMGARVTTGNVEG